MIVRRVPVAAIRALADPYEVEVWDHKEDRPLRIEDVKFCVDFGVLEEESYSAALVEWSLFRHAARVAHLVVAGWHEEPIELVCDDAEWIISDGNHRFAAAIYRGDEYITCKIYGDPLIAELNLGMPIY